MARIQLSKNFYLDEFTRSQTATRHGIEIEVNRGTRLFDNLQRLCQEILQPLRDNLGSVHVTSGYRPPKVNQLIGGATTSRHLRGLAADIVVTGHSPLKVAQWLDRHRMTLPFDYCIHEFGRWVHVSVPPVDERPRYRLLTAYREENGKTRYAAGIHPIDRGKG